MEILAAYLNHELSQTRKPLVVDFLRKALQSNNETEFYGGNRVFLLVNTKDKTVTLQDDIMLCDDYMFPLDDFLGFLVNFTPRQP